MPPIIDPEISGMAKLTRLLITTLARTNFLDDKVRDSKISVLILISMTGPMLQLIFDYGKNVENIIEFFVIFTISAIICYLIGMILSFGNGILSSTNKNQTIESTFWILFSFICYIFLSIYLIIQLDIHKDIDNIDTPFEFHKDFRVYVQLVNLISLFSSLIASLLYLYQL